MIGLQSDRHSGVYLDHNQIINELYNSHVSSSNFHLNPLLFNFKPRPLTSVFNARNRKRKVDSNLSADILDIKDSINALIKKVKECTNITTSTPSNDSIERIWEEASSFPNLKGANDTNEFQGFTLNKKEYLIPPRCKFFNHDLLELSKILPCLPKHDFVVIDPPWKNKYIRRVKRARQGLGYKMLNNEAVLDIPLNALIHCDSVVAIWCTNSKQHQKALLEQFLPQWDLRLVHKIIWFKLNTGGDLIGELRNNGEKQPFEVLFIAHHKESRKDFGELKKLQMILSIPSVIHSHKPPIASLFRAILPEDPNCLELFARYLQPGFTSIGLEVLKLMDKRLYTQSDNEN